jgi:hypothetical protein
VKPWLLWVLLLSLPASAADDPALAAVEACRAKLDPHNDVGLERIEKRCPGLVGILEKAPWHDLLPGDLRARRDELSAESLRALVELVRAANRDDVARDAPRIEDLAPVLSGLGTQGQEGASRWERFKRWLKEKLERRTKDEDEDSWLEELGREFETSEGVARAITYAGYAFLAALVFLVIVSELRAAGLLGGTRREALRTDPRTGWRRRLQLADVSRAPLADRPGLLLRLLGEALTRAHRLPAAEGLTASQIARHARLDDESDRTELERVAATADAVRYSPRRPDDRSLESATGTARSLLGKFVRLASGRR